MVLQNTPALFYVVNGVILLVLLLFSGLVSGSEVAFFSLNPTEIQSLRNGSTGRKAHLFVISKPKRLLATILILNNFINISFVTLSTLLTWQITGSETAEGMVVFILQQSSHF
jgi:putative hemolysin